MRLVCAVLFVTACNRLPPRDLTYHRDVAPILRARCSECHHQGGVAPNPTLEDFASAHTYADAIALSTQTRRMPPWGAENSGVCGTWSDARWLSEREIATLSEWQQIGAPEGEPDAVSSATELPLPFHPEVVVDIGGVYRPGVGGGGNRCFVVDPRLDRDRLLSAIRVVSGDPRGVAQLTLFSLDSDAAETAAQALDAADPELGYSCFGTARAPDARLIWSWTWPTPIRSLPEGTGVRVPAGRKWVVQIHFNVAHTGDGFASGTQVELRFADGANEARVVPIALEGTLAPGLASTEISGVKEVGSRMRVVAIAPRMHIRGKSLTLIAEHAGGALCLGNFDQWNFNDQQLFRAVAPVTLEPGDRLHLHCAYRTLGRAAPVELGEDIDDEECAAYLFVTDSSGR